MAQNEALKLDIGGLTINPAIMKLKSLIYACLFVVAVVSCGKEDTPDPPADTNTAPNINAQSFTVSEDKTTIGTVQADDDEGDALQFSIKTNDNGLFAINAQSGLLSVAEGKSLDFATAAQHSITVSVDDDELSAEATITINVTEVGTQNLAPEGEQNQSFEVNESITQNDLVGAIAATDPEEQPLTYEVTTNDNDLFVINADGELNLAPGKNLDYETEGSHSITVQVSDGSLTLDVAVTITVTDDDIPMKDEAASFVITWQDDSMDSAYLGLSPIYDTYDFTIDWGDGTKERYSGSQLGYNIAHNYTAADTYTIAIQGTFPVLQMGQIVGENNNKLMSIEQWGSIAWQSMEYAFKDCVNMVYNAAASVPELSLVTEMTGMFYNTPNFNGNLSGWNTSTITNMDSMFYNAQSFVGDGLDDWDTQNVTNMQSMFDHAKSFNADISSWDTGQVTTMESMFAEAFSFNQDLSNWDTGEVTNMNYMFVGAFLFNGNIVGWTTHKVQTMAGMFLGASAFDQDLSSWDIGTVTDMTNMFTGSSMSPENYAYALLYWSNQTVQPDVPLGATGVSHCDSPVIDTAKQTLQNQGWTITDAGPTPCN
jgi:surface protein